MPRFSFYELTDMSRYGNPRPLMTGRAGIRRELGITVSIGISWNKIYAEPGSDNNHE